MAVLHLKYKSLHSLIDSAHHTPTSFILGHQLERNYIYNEVAIGPVTGRSYRSGSHVLSIFLFALILLFRVRNGVWCSVRLVLGLGIGFGLALG